MKTLATYLLAFMLSIVSFLPAHAQAAESIWMEVDKDSFNAGETITVTLNAISSTPIQGFSFKLSFDPACMEPSQPVSLLQGLNYMSVPQTSGMVNAIFASSTKITANGALAKVSFTAKSACQTSINLTKASLVVENADGLAASLPGINLGVSSQQITVTGDSAPAADATAQSGGNPAPVSTAVETQNPPATETQPAASSTTAPQSEGSEGGFSLTQILIVVGIILLGVLAFVITLGLRRLSLEKVDPKTAAAPGKAFLLIKRGSQAGTSLPVNRFPCRIGRGSENDIRLVDQHIANTHAQIRLDGIGYSLVDLGSPEGTYINGKLVKNQHAALQDGDVLRFGGVVLVFSQSQD